MLTINPRGAWKLYTTRLPAGSTACGTITRSPGDTGALVQGRTGVYTQVNSGGIRTLPQGEVYAALREHGRLLAQLCANCGQTLTAENIAQALADARGIDLESLAFCCPGYADETGCPGYGAEDQGAMAYWYTR